MADVDTSVIRWINADEVSEVLWSMADGWSDHPVWNWASEATGCTEATSPLSVVQINCEQSIRSSCRLAASKSRNTKHANIYRFNEIAP